MKKKVLTAVTLAFAVAVLVAVGIAAIRTTGTIALAHAKGKQANSVIEKGNELGLGCLIHEEECVEMIVRAERNPRLKQIFLEAKTAGVIIIPSDDILRLGFSTGRIASGYIVINTRASDRRIVAFLTN